MGLTALMLLQHARAPGPLRRRRAQIVLLEDQDRSLWNRQLIAEGLALIDKAMRHRRPGPYQVQAAIAALHARAATPRTPTGPRSTCSTSTLERLQPSPVVTLNRAVAVAKVRGPAGGAGDDRAAGRAARRLLPLPRREGRHAAAARPCPRRRGEAFDRAIALANSAAEAAHIRTQLDRLIKDSAAGAAKAAG